MILIVLVNALFASTFTFAKFMLYYTKPLFFAGSSLCLGGVVLLLYQLMFAPDKLKVARKDIPLFLGVSFFTIYISYGLQFWGLQYMPSFKACFLYNFGPFTSYLIAYFLFNEKMILKKWIGLIIGFVGLIPILISSSPSEKGLSTLLFISLPEVAMIVSAAMYAYGWFLIRRLVHERHYSTLTVNGYSMLLGGALLLSNVPFVEGGVHIKEHIPFFGLLLTITTVEYLICNNLYTLLLNRYSETFMSFSSFLIPVFGALYGFIFLHEVITWHFFVSLGIIAVAIWLFYKAELETNPTHTRE